MISVYQFSMALSLAVDPRSQIFGSCCSISVRSLTVPNVGLPLPLIRVVIDVEVLAEATSLIIDPAAYSEEQEE